MYPAMRGADDWTVIYFILITVIGNFMLFNLFVAIIITGFSENKADILKEEKENAVMQEHDKMNKSASIGRGSSIGRKQSLRSNQSLARGMSIKSSSKSKGDMSKKNSIGSTTASKPSFISDLVVWFKVKVFGVQQVTPDHHALQDTLQHTLQQPLQDTLQDPLQDPLQHPPQHTLQHTLQHRRRNVSSNAM